MGAFGGTGGTGLYGRLALAVGEEVSILTNGGRHTDQLQTSTGRAGPGICRGCIAFDLSLSATITGSHH